MSRSIISKASIILAVLFAASPLSAAITRTGSVNTFTDDNNASSTSVSIPSDAEFCAFGVTGFDPTASFFSSGTVTLGGSAMTGVVAFDTDTTKFMGALFYKNLPATGAQTLAWDWAGTNTPSDRTVVAWACYKGADTSSPIRSSNGAQQANNPHATSTLTAVSGDFIIAWMGQFSATEATITWTGATEALAITIGLWSTDGSWAEASPTGNQTVSASGSTDNDGGVAALVLKQASGGGGTTARNLLLMGVGQ